MPSVTQLNHSQSGSDLLFKILPELRNKRSSWTQLLTKFFFLTRKQSYKPCFRILYQITVSNTATEAAGLAIMISTRIMCSWRQLLTKLRLPVLKLQLQPPQAQFRLGSTV